MTEAAEGGRRAGVGRNRATRGDRAGRGARGGAVTTRLRRSGVACLVLAAGSGVTGCQTVATADPEAIAAAATVQAAADGGPARLVLTEDSVQRLGIETAPVAEGDGGLTVPYSAVVYAADGSTWAFAELAEGTYQRQPLTVTTIEEDVALLSAGPRPGTEVVTVAAAELVGVEAGISGGE